MVAPIILAGLRFIIGAAVSSIVSSEMGETDESQEMLAYLDKLKDKTDKGAAMAAEDAAAVIHAEVTAAIRELGLVASSDLLRSVTTSGMIPSTESMSVMVGSSS